MATPELYLSLLSGRYDGVSRISVEPRHSDVESHISGHPFANDHDRFMDLLDALAAICVGKAKEEIFFVSLAMAPGSATLYISSNQTVPALVANYLRKIRGQLKDVLECDPSTTTNTESSPNPKGIERRAELTLELQKTIYEHTYSKLRQRVLKRAPGVLEVYSSVVERLEAEGVTTDDSAILRVLREFLEWAVKLLQHENPPCGKDLEGLIWWMEACSADRRLKVEGDANIVTRFDNSVRTSGLALRTRVNGSSTSLTLRAGVLSLRRLLEKLLTLHHHISAIMRVAWSRRLQHFLTGTFEVVPVPTGHHAISIRFSEGDVLPIIFPLGDGVKQDVQKRVYNMLLGRFKEKMKDEGLVFEKGTVPQLSMNVGIHAECNLLAYHLRHPETDPYRYFGGSKLSCHACATFFSSYNSVAKSSSRQYFTKGCHNKIYLRWSLPSLLPVQQQIQSQGKGSNLDTEVREKMVRTLSTELAPFVEELRTVAQAPSPSLTDSTDASGPSQPPFRKTMEDVRDFLLGP